MPPCLPPQAPDTPDTSDLPAIVLATLNAKYSHASLGLRYLAANMDLHGGAGLRIQRFARYWEMVANSGRFAAVLRLLLCDETDSAGSAFNHFLAFSDWLWRTTAKTHEFALEKLLDLLFEHLTQARGLNGDAVRAALLADYRASGARGRPQCLAELLAGGRMALPAGTGKSGAERQGRHVSQQTHRDAIQKAAAAA